MIMTIISGFYQAKELDYPLIIHSTAVGGNTQHIFSQKSDVAATQYLRKARCDFKNPREMGCVKNSHLSLSANSIILC